MARGKQLGRKRSLDGRRGRNANGRGRRVSDRAKSIAAGRGRRRPIDVYFWPTPNGLKITVMLEECGLPYHVIPVNIAKGDQFKPEFLKISPNNRIPAIVDPDGPDGRPISVFESGAILQYLGRKTGRFYPKDERKRVRVDEWLHWQIANLGPMAGQAHHFRLYAPEKLPYAIDRYTNECRRLYRIMNDQLARQEYLAGDLSIADFACLGWARRLERQGQDIGEFPHVKRWLDTLMARPATARGLAVTAPEYGKIDFTKDKSAWNLLFTQGARA